MGLYMQSITRRLIYILGLMTALAYMIAILLVWMLAEFTGYTFFSAGEPNRVILYTEWILGFNAIYSLVIYCKREIINYAGITHI